MEKKKSKKTFWIYIVILFLGIWIIVDSYKKKRIIITERLILRKLVSSDFKKLHLILSNKQTMQYYPKPFSKSEIKAWIKRNIKSYHENGYGLWAVLLKKNKRFIGECGISNQLIDGQIVPEIGYHINKKYWNQGYGTEAAKSSLEYGFEVLNLDEIYIHISVENIPSIRIAEKIGMKKIKEYDKYNKKHDVTMSHVVYSIKKENRRVL